MENHSALTVAPKYARRFELFLYLYRADRSAYCVVLLSMAAMANSASSAG